MDSIFVDSQKGVEAMGRALESADIIALDIECSNNLHHYVSRVCLMQLFAGGETYIVDALAPVNLDPVGLLLENPAIEIVMHDTDFDLRSLDRHFGWHPRHMFDTLIAARLCGHREFGLAPLLNRYFGIERSKKFQRADWTLRPLPKNMIEYAADDVTELLRLRHQLAGELEKLGRMEWAMAEFALCEEKRYMADERPLFARVKKARDLCSGRDLAILSELAQLRDTIARELDLPHFMIIADEYLIELARRPPRSVEELSARRGMHPICKKKYAGYIMDAVRKGKIAPSLQWPRSAGRGGYSRDIFDALKKWRNGYASELDIDPDLVLSMESLRDLAGGDTIDAVLQKEPIRIWRGGEIRHQVAELLSGFNSRG